MRGAQERQIMQMAVAKKVRKSYEQLAFIEKARNTGTDSAINGRYLSVGFNNQRISKIDQDYSSSVNMASMGKSTNDTNFKKSDASSFTQISSDFQKTEVEKENIAQFANSRSNRIGEARR